MHTMINLMIAQAPKGGLEEGFAVAVEADGMTVIVTVTEKEIEMTEAPRTGDDGVAHEAPRIETLLGGT